MGRPGLLMLAFLSSSVAAAGMPRIELPPGFEISVYADRVPNARQLTRSAGGVVYAGSREDGGVHAVIDRDGDFVADEVKTVARDLNMPSGVAWRDGSLYVAEVSRILRYDDIDAHLDDPPAPVVIHDALPDARHHGWKFIAFGPDGLLYVPVGAPCNVCLRDPPYATIQRMRADGSGRETYALGVRNSVGFAWRPGTNELWFTDNGRDMLGDELPSCELNRATAPGQHFGFPYLHGGDVPDPEFHALADAPAFVPPVLKLGPHVAPLGVLFYTGTQFPPEYRGSLLVAEHGSWNRSEPIGYRVVRVDIDAAGKVVGHEVFASGWLAGREVHGRPVDLELLPDGSVLLSDDEADRIYRIRYLAH
ncbi:MAG TPA: PQQ-dependent sugar dehydrogenase [Gammaproteobacteria bacterium]|nr:PQQ-dependent sugar dehydrogenase [Gammaproteobacteria bacterium]